MSTLLRASAIAVAVGLTAACSTVEPSPAPPGEPAEEQVAATTLFATTTVLGSVVSDIAECVGNDAVTIEVLMPIGADPHDFAASSEQLAQMSRAGLVVANGLGLEAGLSDALEQIEADGGEILHVAEWVDPLPFGEHTDDDGHDHGHDEEEQVADEHEHGDFDPHFWLDMSRMALVATQLGGEFQPLLGEEAPACGEAVAQKILSAEEEVFNTLSGVPDERRVLVTDHDSFGYFAERYGFAIAGVVIPGGSTLADPSSADLAALVATIEQRGIPALMGSYYEQSDLLEAVAEESGNLSVVPLYVGSIGAPDSEASDYSSMMLTNARLISEALGGR